MCRVYLVARDKLPPDLDPFPMLISNLHALKCGTSFLTTKSSADSEVTYHLCIAQSQISQLAFDSLDHLLKSKSLGRNKTKRYNQCFLTALCLYDLLNRPVLDKSGREKESRSSAERRVVCKRYLHEYLSLISPRCDFHFMTFRSPLPEVNGPDGIELCPQFIDFCSTSCRFLEPNTATRIFLRAFFGAADLIEAAAPALVLPSSVLSTRFEPFRLHSTHSARYTPQYDDPKQIIGVWLYSGKEFQFSSRTRLNSAGPNSSAYFYDLERGLA